MTQKSIHIQMCRGAGINRPTIAVEMCCVLKKLKWYSLNVWSPYLKKTRSFSDGTRTWVLSRHFGNSNQITFSRISENRTRHPIHSHLQIHDSKCGSEWGKGSYIIDVTNCLIYVDAPSQIPLTRTKTYATNFLIPSSA